MSEKENKLVQTKGSFTLKGIVSGMNKENAYREGEVKNGKNRGKMYRSIRFSVQTSPTNKPSVELFGMETDYVYPYKRGKKGEKGHVIKNHPFAKRNDLPDGYTLIGVNVGLEQDEKGKNIRKSLIDYDAVEYIYDNLNDGDSVFLTGELQFSSYVNSQGEEVDQTKYIIKQVFHEKNPIDFDDENFEEVCAFEQEIVFTGSEVLKEEKAVVVRGYTIAYGGKFNTAEFVIRPDGDKDIEKTAKAFSGKKIKFGDTMTVFGLCLNRAETVEVEDEEEDDFFGGKKPKGLERNTITNYTTELQITGATDYAPGVYTEEDFIIEEDELVDDTDNGSLSDDSDDDYNPFADDEDDENPFGDDDDLPF